MKKNIVFFNSLVIATHILSADSTYPKFQPVDWIRFAETTEAADSAAASTLSTEDSALVKEALRLERNKTAAARYRERMNQFTHALAQELERRNVAYSDDGIIGSARSPQRPNESAKSHTISCNRITAKTSRDKKKFQLNNMMSAYNGLNQQAKDAIVAALKAQKIPHLDMLCPTPLSELKRRQQGKIPDTMYNDLFLDTLHEQLSAHSFVLSPSDTTKKSRFLAMLTAYHEHPEQVKSEIIAALNAAGILQAESRLKVTPEQLLERQKRKLELSNAAYRRRKEQRTQSTQ